MGNLISQCGSQRQLRDLHLAWEVFSGCDRCDPQFSQDQEQQHAQSQAQIKFFKQQNWLFNQQLATQAQSHIQHLQQTMPPHPQPNPQQAPRPNPDQSPTPPAPKAESAAAATTINTDEVVKRPHEDLKGELASTLCEVHSNTSKRLSSHNNLQLNHQINSHYQLQFPAHNHHQISIHAILRNILPKVYL